MASDGVTKQNAAAYALVVKMLAERDSEIERLQREETEYMKRCSEQHEWEENERVRLQAEIERLRAALRDMLDLRGNPYREEWMNDTAFELAKQVHQRARHVLEQERNTRRVFEQERKE